MFKDMKKDGLGESEDRLGGFAPLASDIYVGTIKMAFADKSQHGAQSVTVIAEFGGKEYEETVYISNRKGEHFYLDKNDGMKKKPLPGFTTIDDICLVCTGEPLSAQDPHLEEKMVKVYDTTAKARIPKSKPVITSLIGQPVAFAIDNILENKSKKEGDDYVDIPETRTSNAISKVFEPTSKMTVVEARREAETAEFWDAWLKQNKGRVIDKRTIKDGGVAGTNGAPQSAKAQANGAAPAAESAAPKRSLFGKK